MQLRSCNLLGGVGPEEELLKRLKTQAWQGSTQTLRQSAGCRMGCPATVAWRELLRVLLLASATATLTAAEDTCDIQVWTHFISAVLGGSTDASCEGSPDLQGDCLSTLGQLPPEYLSKLLASSDGGGIGSDATTAVGYCGDLCRLGCMSPSTALPLWYESPCSPAIKATPGLISIRLQCGMPWGLILLGTLVCTCCCGCIRLRRGAAHKSSAQNVVGERGALLALPMQQLGSEPQGGSS